MKVIALDDESDKTIGASARLHYIDSLYEWH